jgi:hypothetical protein
MIADISYGAVMNKKFVQDWYLDKGKDFGPSCIGIMANATGVPCINISFWIGEVTDWPEWIVKTIESLIKFYGYTNVTNKPDRCPI